ncbi:MAG: magnesium transporter [Caldilineaceae bacterium]|nr:magnesium transporter [Caldilineaceae bacterium]MCB9136932.1 magnesium transporter [Caldilineaceae bacterium]
MVEPIKIEDALQQVTDLLTTNQAEAAGEFIRTLHPADSAEVIAMLEPEQQAQIAARIEPVELADIFEQLDEDEMVEVAEHLDTETLADVLDAMEPDMAADLLGELDDAEMYELLAEMDDSSGVRHLLEYDEDSAGGIMNSPPPCLRRWMTVAEGFEFIRSHYRTDNELYYLYVLDRFGTLIGVVNLRTLILAKPDETIETIMNRDVISTATDADQEEVAQLLARYDLLALPVVDGEHKLVGIISVDDVVDVLEEEATEDIYRLAQISEDAEIFSPLPRALRNRLPWLYINMATALISATVVTSFEGTIALIPVLAAFMPVVAAQGGNTGNQTMTIVVRSLALGEIDLSDTWRALRHELMVGIVIGLLLGISLGGISYFWHHSVWLSLLTTVAMIVTLFVAAVVGVLVPTTLKRAGLDPALGSSMFVTAFTDITGFAVFLGLATLLLQYLL